MTKRLKIICSYITAGDIFADVGCDHGYVAKYVLDNNLFNTVIISDVSAKSLQKAQRLLSGYAENIVSYCSDGFCDYTLHPTDVCIAGMGGEEICHILKNSPKSVNKLILSPQKNTDKVRLFLISNGYKIERDYTFKDDKFYDLIVAVKGADTYTDMEILFGRDNLKEKGEDFILKLHKEKNLCLKVISKSNKDTNSYKLAKEKLNFIKEILNEQ